MTLLKGLLINLLVILVLVLFYNMVVVNQQKRISPHFQKSVLAFFSSILIILSLLLSTAIEDNFAYDLRFIPFLLGSLYGGKKVTLWLGALLISARIPIGGDGIWLTVLLVICFSIIFIPLSSRFEEKSIKWRLFSTTFLAFLYSILALLIPSFYYSFYNVETFIIYSFVLTSATFFVTYLTELLRTAYILQQKAIKNEKMEIASHLAASISHEVRNPLTSIKGFLQLILEQRDVPNKCRLYASLALDEASRTADIIDDYLTFAKPHPEKLHALEIDKEILQCKDLISPLAIQHSVDIKIVFFHTDKIKGDPHKFRQVLLNICKNSIEAMPTGGTLTIVTATKYNETFIHITDTGLGMSPDHLARLGEPYFSLKEQKGTGLGMMVVFRIVEGMGGNIKVNSEEQVGTSITLSFPSFA
ncbi:HAMP domain-containing sensor histidine kinase [Robertmurraya sp. DFI.2.37]|uniref:sensor histidine kinase n=1 Tax=Robertmurraya sp. DFI.2.37 TaxID=3031819 RepID=UPI00177CC09B|nr:HAMP domain-containing sensor histidine kinase [Robertmurraya sp. DFI.2.37]MDF1507920.1 HAMP domain-containing sensor histidine kinase [Robertmurraya sp. DFI.2.37]